MHPIVRYSVCALPKCTICTVLLAEQETLSKCNYSAGQETLSTLPANATGKVKKRHQSARKRIQKESSSDKICSERMLQSEIPL